MLGRIYSVKKSRTAAPLGLDAICRFLGHSHRTAGKSTMPLNDGNASCASEVDAPKPSKQQRKKMPIEGTVELCDLNSPGHINLMMPVRLSDTEVSIVRVWHHYDEGWHATVGFKIKECTKTPCETVVRQLCQNLLMRSTAMNATARMGIGGYTDKVCGYKRVGSVISLE